MCAKQGVACESFFCVIFLLYFFLWNDLLNCSPVSATTFCDTQSQIGRCRIVSILITGAIHQKRTSRRCFYLRVHSRFEFQIGHYKITTKQTSYLSTLNFCKSSSFRCQVWWTGFFFPSLKFIFLPAVACKIQVWNRQKINFIKLDVSNWRIEKSNADR